MTNPEQIPDSGAIATKRVTLSLVPSRYVTIEVAAVITGYSVSAINNKIDGGFWLEGKEWRKPPDGRRLIDLEGYNKWVERGKR